MSETNGMPAKMYGHQSGSSPVSWNERARKCLAGRCSARKSEWSAYRTSVGWRTKGAKNTRPRRPISKGDRQHFTRGTLMHAEGSWVNGFWEYSTRRCAEFL